MLIFIAAPWKDRGDMSEIARQCEKLGHTITHKWWETEDISESERTRERLREQALLDSQGVMDADVMLLINSSKSEGKAVEQGLAIALNKPIVAVGKLGEFSQNVYHYTDNYLWAPTLKLALDCMNGFVESWYA